MSFKSGFAAITGMPNVGKSTLINSITGEKISIVSDKPQTTRNSIKAIITKEDSQVIFIDTPGIHAPRNKLGEHMVKSAVNAFNEVDVILYVVDANFSYNDKRELYIIEQLKKVKTPVLLVINKIDLVKKQDILSLISEYKDKMDFKSVIPISALTGDGVSLITQEISDIIPEGPRYFPDDMITDQPEKLIVAELIREKVLYFIEDEIPHGIGVEVILFKERENKNILDINANIYCEKSSHKGILIGKEGKMLKKVGSMAREEIENIFGIKVFLQIWVKVKNNWRNSDLMLKNLGYK